MSTTDLLGGPANGAEPIPSLAFNPPEPRVPAFEITDLATLYRRIRRRQPGGPHRIDFHTVTLVTQGSDEHTVDFVTYPRRPGTLLWVRPGQVQRFGPRRRVNGIHLLFTAAFLPHSSAASHLLNEWYGPACWQLSTSPGHADVSELLNLLRVEFTRPAGEVSAEILQLLLAALLLHIDRLPRPARLDSPHATAEPYARFRAELERSYASTRRAEDYAQILGCTVKTLTRACLAATGQSVKHIIDARVALEGQRLLAHTDDPVASITRRLGFSEPTNFGKFFTRHTGTTPGEFRRTQRTPE